MNVPVCQDCAMPFLSPRKHFGALDHEERILPSAHNCLRTVFILFAGVRRVLLPQPLNWRVTVPEPAPWKSH
jgi:hypothetical protein